MSLQKIQAELKAPKGQYNEFGKYNYRSCEDILEAVKPLLAEYGYALIVSDKIVEVGDRVYVCAQAGLIKEKEDGTLDEKQTTAYGFAREPENRKGMDESQITGAASSYARKYALNGLFAIDDTRDADATNDGNGGKKAKQEEPPEPEKSDKDKRKEDGATKCKELLGTLPKNTQKLIGEEYGRFELMNLKELIKCHKAMSKEVTDGGQT